MFNEIAKEYLKAQEHWENSFDFNLGVESFASYLDNKFMNKSSIIEYGGTMHCMTSDGRIVNMADELNRLGKDAVD